MEAFSSSEIQPEEMSIEERTNPLGIQISEEYKEDRKRAWETEPVVWVDKQLWSGESRKDGWRIFALIIDGKLSNLDVVDPTSGKTAPGSDKPYIWSWDVPWHVVEGFGNSASVTETMDIALVVYRHNQSVFLDSLE